MREEQLHTAAYELYKQGLYGKARTLFEQLVLIDPLERRYWKGVASASQMSLDYDQAMHAWSMVALLDPADPHPSFHVAECLMQLGKEEEAKEALAETERLRPPAALEERVAELKERLCYVR
jgi:type III secretion system low calcium response chaperone LcrH/SycD